MNLRQARKKAKQEGWLEWVKTPLDKKAITQGYYFDIKAAEHVKEFFEKFLVFTTGKRWAGKPFILPDWQWRKIIAPLYGWKRPNGTRRFRRGYLSTPKKNGKTTLCSALLLYHLLADGEPDAHVYSAATSRDQAAHIYKAASSMVKASPMLLKYIECIDNAKTLRVIGTTSFYQALSKDANSCEGINASYLVYDELAFAKSRDLYEALEYSGAGRDEPLSLVITTAGENTNSVCYELYDFGKTNNEDLSFFSAIWEAEKDADWSKLKVWQLANPMLGTILDLEDFRSDWMAAKRTPTKEYAWRKYRLNQWVTDSANAFVLSTDWDACINPRANKSDLEDQECYAGVDLSSRTDITALVLIFPKKEEGVITSYDILPHFFIPAEQAKKREIKDKVPYRTWAQQGVITMTPGNYVDQRIVRKYINELAETYRIVRIGIDDWNAAKLIVELTDEDGFDVVSFRQGHKSYNEPMKHLEGLILDHQLNHYGNPILRDHVLNTRVDLDANNNYRPKKEKPGSAKRIDGAAALIMALGMADLEPEDSGVGFDFIEWAS